MLQAINLYNERPYLQPGMPEARDFTQATEHSKQLTNAFRGDIQKFWDELETARQKLQVTSVLGEAGLLPFLLPFTLCSFLSWTFSALSFLAECRRCIMLFEGCMKR
jgi:hypothetical protein